VPRARLVKPAFFKDEDLARLSFAHRLCFEGLWVLADREGRLEDRPEWIKAELFPYDRRMTVREVDRMLRNLAKGGFAVRYADRSHRRYIAIPTFLKHQTPHHREPASRIPAPPTRTRSGKISNNGNLGPSPGPAYGQPDPGRTVPVPVPVPVQTPLSPLSGGHAGRGRKRRDVAGFANCAHDPQCESIRACRDRTLAEARTAAESRP
jgi:hypothetical protein